METAGAFAPKTRAKQCLRFGIGRHDARKGAGFSEAVLIRDVPLRIKRRGVEMRLVIEGPSANSTDPDPVLLKEIRRAHRCFEALVSGQAGSVAELATTEGSAIAT
jgi:hypothetical protein